MVWIHYHSPLKIVLYVNILRKKSIHKWKKNLIAGLCKVKNGMKCFPTKWTDMGTVFCELSYLYFVYCLTCILCIVLPVFLCIVLPVFCVLSYLYFVYCLTCILCIVLAKNISLVWRYCHWKDSRVYPLDLYWVMFARLLILLPLMTSHWYLR